MKKQAYRVRGMDCAEEIALLKREVGPVTGGPENLEFDLLNGKMIVNAEAPVDEDAVMGAVRRAGMDAEPWDAAGAAEHEGWRGFWRNYGRTVLCAVSGVFLLAAFSVHTAGSGLAAALTGGEGAPAAVTAMYGAAIVTGGRYIFPKAVLAARRLRPDMNLLMTVAVIGAVGIGEWFEAGTVTFLFALALLLESWSVSRARNAIRALMDLAPTQARYICPNDGCIEEKRVEDVPVGVTAIVRPGERIPLDGVITKGQTSVNQAPITGESTPVTKGPDDEIFAGAINNEGAIEFRVTKLARDTTLARVIRMVEEAQSRRAPSDQWVERFARVYTPAMMGVAVLAAVVPPLALGAAWGAAFYNALVLLVIACPCALVISTPVTIVAGLATAARMGVLVKGGVFLEAPARIRAVAIDKTGTLTYGEPSVQHIAPQNSHTEAELLARAAGMERHSEHPIARAVVRRAADEGVEPLEAEDFTAAPGLGATARIEGRPFWIGSHRFGRQMAPDEARANEMALTLEDAGHSVVMVGNEEHVCGLISVADSVRPEAASAVRELKAAGIEEVVMLTGDNEGAAQAIAEAVGVDRFEAELLPEDKVAAVEELVRRHGGAAMVGDGINDAPALAASSLGIAMGAAGTDAAIETADIALMSDDLTRVSWLVRHSRRTLRTIKQNIAVALGLKALFILLALLGYATLWMAIAADMGASLLVIANGLRLLRDREDAAAEPQRSEAPAPAQT